MILHVSKVAAGMWMQVRHGAALALREVLRHQAAAAGILAPVVPNPTGTAPWPLEPDIAINEAVAAICMSWLRPACLVPQDFLIIC